MRRSTGWALGGMLAGTLLLGAGSTMATFTDTETLSAIAGAGRLALVDPAPGRSPQQLSVGPSVGVLPVDLDVVGTGTAELRLWAQNSRGVDPCAEPILLTVTTSASVEPVEADLCSLAGTGITLLEVDSTTPDLTLSVSASLDGDVGPRARQWKGDLRLELVQAGDTGFSDEQRVPVHVVVPNPQGGNGNGRGAGGPN